MKKAVITGASSGLGHEIASIFIKDGIKVINLSRTPSKRPLINIKTDLTKNSDIEKAIKIINKDHKDVDILVLCAGVLHRHKEEPSPIEEVDNDFAVNVTGAIKITERLIPLIKKNKGDIVIIGSTSSFICYPESLVYQSAKHAVLGFIKSLQAEYKKEDIRILGIHPGGFNSPFHIKAKSDLKPKDLMDVKDLANLIVSLLKLPRNMEVSEIIINRKHP